MNLENAFKKMLSQEQQVIISLKENGKEKEYAIWNVSEEDQEIWMYPIENVIYGNFRDELITDSFDMTLSTDFDEDATGKIMDALEDEKQWVDVEYQELKPDYPPGHEFHEDRMIMVPKGNPFLENATGRYLVPNAEFQFSYK